MRLNKKNRGGGNVNRIYSDELLHYGVKGQKWGVRRYQNPDGSLTEAGRKRLAKQMKRNVQFDKPFIGDEPLGIYRGVSYDQKKLNDMPELQKAHSSLKSARQEMYETLEFAKKFESDRALLEKYQEKAARLACKEYGITDPDGIEIMIRGFKYDDLDQGTNNSFELYCKDKGVNYDAYVEKCYQAEKKYDDACRKTVEQMLGHYGNERVTNLTRTINDQTITDVATESLARLSYDERDRERYWVRT